MPDRPDIRDEYRIILEGAGWVERTGRGRIRLEGKDVGSFLQALVSNDVSRVESGQGVYATYLTPTGRMLADFEIFRRPESWVVGLAAELVSPIVERLDQSIFSEDVRVADASSTLVEIVIVGSQATARLADVLGVSSSALDTLSELGQVTYEGGFIARLGESTLPMFTAIIPSTRRSEIVDRLTAGNVETVTPALLEALRIDAGRPRFGADMSAETIPLEAGLLERAISTSKGCYVGQEIVIRILHRGGGRVAKRLVTLSFDVPLEGLPAPGTGLFDDEKNVGQLTSVSASVTSASASALGYVQRDLAEANRRLRVGHTESIATVTGFAR